MTANSKQSRGKKNYSIIGFILLFLVGAGILFYPKISYWFADYNHVVAHQSYERNVADLTNDEKKAIWDKAVLYNSRLVDSVVKDPFAETKNIDPFDEYDETLDIGEGEMGYIHIPKINVMIPIYHGVSNEVLDKGIGHIKATALPVGGEGTHSVLTGHSGLSHAMMFNELEKLNIKDQFYLQILDETLSYEVRRIEIVLPDDVSLLHRETGKDKVTLITCTPYGVNSHRLLVMGERVPFISPIPKQQREERPEFPWWIVILVILILLLVIAIGRKIRKNAEEKQRKNSSSPNLSNGTGDIHISKRK